MRDGVKLRADLLRPAGQGPFATLVYRTPYDKAEERRTYSTFGRALERGYALVVQDVRGRYASEGDFHPYEQESNDGYDTIEWAATQPWSNGAVGTFGLSYPGAVQWLAAVEGPPHLKAMVPAMTFASQEGFVHASGAFDMSWVGWVWNEIAPDRRHRQHLAGPSNASEAAATWRTEGAAMLSVLPLDRMDRLRDIAPFYYEWLRHPPDDPWWAWLDLRAKFGRTRAAVLNLSGWYDEGYGDEGAIINFQGWWLPARAKPRVWRCCLGRGPTAWRTRAARWRASAISRTTPRSTTTVRFSIGWITTCVACATAWATASRSDTT